MRESEEEEEGGREGEARDSILCREVKIGRSQEKEREEGREGRGGRGEKKTVRAIQTSSLYVCAGVRGSV